VTTLTTGPGPTARRGFWPLRDVPVVLWLAGVVVVALVHPLVPAPRWLLIHLLLLGAVTHAILVWSRHFSDAVLHTPPRENDRRTQSVRLLLLNAGVAAVLAGVVGEAWPVTVAGATGVAAAVVAHGASLFRDLRRALPARFGVTVRYYVAAASLLPVGLLLGTLLARGVGDPRHDQLMVAHVAVNVLGWMGLTVAGTLLTLWPTMLRTRIVPGAERAARRALPLQVVAVLVTAGSAVVGLLPLVAVGVAAYLGSLVVAAWPFVGAARAKPPASYPTWSVLASLLWLVGALVALAAGFATASSWSVAGGRFETVTPVLAAGFGAQVLLGALSYLVPVVLGGGPTPVRAADAVLARGGALRIALVNGGLLVAVLPVPSIVRVLASTLVLGGLASFLPLLFLAMRASRRAKAAPPPAVRVPYRAEPSAATRGRNVGHAATGLAAVVLAVAVGVALDPAAVGSGSGGDASAGVAATGQVTTVEVSAVHMRFTPSTIEVPAGNRLVLEVTNTDEHGDVHDLTMETGDHTPRLAGGESATLDLGVVGRDLEGWCSVLGHRQMGMVLHVRVTGAGTTEGSAKGGAHDHGSAGQMGSMDMPGSASDTGTGAAADLDFSATPPAGFVARDATLPAAPDGRVHRRTFHITDTVTEVAPGVTQKLWTYEGTAPGPVLHGRVGDVFEITLVNDADVGHSIDFHAGSLAPDGPMRTIGPGESLVYRFRADLAGIWMYHCSTMPMSAHIANGLFGAVVVEPRGLPRVDRNYVLVQSELYLGAQGEVADMAKIAAEQPDAVVFNGYVNQYDARPLAARAGERVRIWVLDAGPNRPTAFHVVGGRFDPVWSEGAYRLRPGPARGGSQSLALAPSQGGFVELTFPEPGHYPFVSHLMVDAERGAHGIFDVTG
jgi:nitrite reductase (NO-forming)